MTATNEHHCPPDHKHGQTGTCYSSHFCRCADCREEHRRAAHALRRAKLYGRYRPPEMVDAEPVRQHVRTLSEFGIGIDRVGAIANVTEAGIRNLMYGRTGRSVDTRRTPPKQVGAELARRVLAVRREVRHLAANAVIPARGVQRRLQALIRNGWSQRKLAARLDMAPAQFGKLLHRTPGVTKAMHERIAALFIELWDKKPPRTAHRDLIAYNRAVKLAIENGWQPALAWDDIDLDDGPARVERSHDDIDDSAVELAIAGEAVSLTPAERRIALRRLHADGLTDPEIAAQLGCSDRTVLRIRQELELPHNDTVHNPSTAARAA
ncbi:MAG: helix-turn-helix domain-containing protein [Curtobacterium sp.]